MVSSADESKDQQYRGSSLDGVESSESYLVDLEDHMWMSKVVFGCARLYLEYGSDRDAYASKNGTETKFHSPVIVEVIIHILILVFIILLLLGSVMRSV